MCGSLKSHRSAGTGRLWVVRAGGPPGQHICSEDFWVAKGSGCALTVQGKLCGLKGASMLLPGPWPSSTTLHEEAMGLPVSSTSGLGL